MANASKTVTMAVAREKFWKAVTDYMSYPTFVDGVHKVEIISKEGTSSKVRYGISLMNKEINYLLNHDESAIPNKMEWSCVESNFLKSNKGSWVVKELGPEKIEVTYTVEIEFTIPVPSLMLSPIIRSTLPRMLDSFEKKAKAL